MKKTLNTMAITAAVCLTLGGVAKAGSMGYPEERYSTTEIDTQPAIVETQPTIMERRVVTTQPAIVETQPTIMERRVVTTQPAIVETQPTIVQRRVVTTQPTVVERRVVTTRPTIVERRVVTQSPTIAYEEPSLARRVVTWPFRAARTAVRTPVIVGETLSGRRAITSDRGVVVERDTNIAYDEGLATRRTVRRLSSRPLYYTGRGVVRTGRTIVRSPIIVGETLSGRRAVINEEGRPFAY